MRGLLPEDATIKAALRLRYKTETGLDLDKNAVQRIESGQRFVTDIELRTLAHVLNVSYETLLED